MAELRFRGGLSEEEEEGSRASREEVLERGAAEEEEGRSEEEEPAPPGSPFWVAVSLLFLGRRPAVSWASMGHKVVFWWPLLCAQHAWAAELLQVVGC